MQIAPMQNDLDHAIHIISTCTSTFKSLGSVRFFKVIKKKKNADQGCIHLFKSSTIVKTTSFCTVIYFKMQFIPVIILQSCHMTLQKSYLVLKKHLLISTIPANDCIPVVLFKILNGKFKRTFI